MVTTTINRGTPREVRRDPPDPPLPMVVVEEQQWIFTEAELMQTPSIMAGMSPEEERAVRRKGVNFILQVGIMLKIPQTTLSTAAVFFNRFLMRNSLKPAPNYKPLHHYQIAGTALFLATKVEENCRKMKEVVIACVRVALKDPNKLVDEQTKDYWKWRDTILFSEDVMLESLCFDLSVEPPYKVMYNMLKYYNLEHDKQLRNGAWAFLSDSHLTECCLLFTARTIAAASLYAGARFADIELPPDDSGKPWWEVQHVKLRDIRRACELMANIYEQGPANGSEPTVYSGLRSPEDIEMKSFQTPISGTNGDNVSQPKDVKTESDAVNGNEYDTAIANANTRANGDGDRNTGVADDGSEEGELDG